MRLPRGNNRRSGCTAVSAIASTPKLILRRSSSTEGSPEGAQWHVQPASPTTTSPSSTQRSGATPTASSTSPTTPGIIDCNGNRVPSIREQNATLSGLPHMAASAEYDPALRSLYPHSRLFDAMGREVWIQESRTTENDGPDYESGPPSLFQAPKKKPSSKGKGAKKDAKQVERKSARRGKPSAKAKEALAVAQPASGGEDDQGISSSSTSIPEPEQVQRRSKRKRNAEPANSDISFTSAQPTDPSPARVNCILDELRISKRSKRARHASPPGSALPPRSPTASRGDHHPQTDWLGERRDYVTTPFSTPPTPVRDSIVGHGLQSSAATRQSFESGAMRHLPSDSIEYGFEACDNSEDSGDDAETIIGDIAYLGSRSPDLSATLSSESTVTTPTTADLGAAALHIQPERSPLGLDLLVMAGTGFYTTTPPGSPRIGDAWWLTMSGSPVTAAPPSQSGSEAPENEEMIGSTAMSRSLSSASSLSTAPSDVLYTPIAHRALTLPTVSEDDAIDTQYSVSASNSRSDSAGDPGLEITVATETRSESLRAARKTAREERAAQARERITDMSHAHRAARYHHLANAKHALSGCRDLAACALGKSSGPSSTQ